MGHDRRLAARPHDERHVLRGNPRGRPRPGPGTRRRRHDRPHDRDRRIRPHDRRAGRRRGGSRPRDGPRGADPIGRGGHGLGVRGGARLPGLGRARRVRHGHRPRADGHGPRHGIGDRPPQRAPHARGRPRSASRGAGRWRPGTRRDRRNDLREGPDGHVLRPDHQADHPRLRSRGASAHAAGRGGHDPGRRHVPDRAHGDRGDRDVRPQVQHARSRGPRRRDGRTAGRRGRARVAARAGLRGW